MDEADRCDALLLIREGQLLAAGHAGGASRANGSRAARRGVPAADRDGLMSVRVTLAVTARVLAQLRRDPRTIALIVGVPCLLETLLKELFRAAPCSSTSVAPLLGLFPFVTMFLVTSITMLRERTSGTLERLMTMPLAKLDLLAGYGIAFALVAVVQAAVVSSLSFGLLDLHVAGRACRGRRLGGRERGARQLARALRQRVRRRRSSRPCSSCPRSCSRRSSSAASSSPRDAMATWLRWISDALPLTYAYDALARTAAGTLRLALRRRRRRRLRLHRCSPSRSGRRRCAGEPL